MTNVLTPDQSTSYAFLMGGITGLIFGTILLVRQDEAIGVVTLLIGLWWLIQGAFSIFSVLIDRTGMWWKLLIGVIGVSAGIVALANPVQTGQVLGSTLAVVLGVMGLTTGVVSVAGGLRGGGFGPILFGVVSAAIGLLLMLYPEGSFSTLVTILGIVLLAEGIAALSLVFTTR